MAQPERVRRGRIAPFAGIAACLLYACLAAASGIDAAGAEDGRLAQKVPLALAHQSLGERGSWLIVTGQADRIGDLGRLAVDRMPMDPASSALLGTRLGLGGDEPGALAAFRVSALLGWRNRFTQLFWMNNALLAGDHAVAGLRLDALLRQNPELVRERTLLDPMERDPRGQAVLVRHLAAAPGWRERYLGDVFGLPREVVVQRAGILRQLAGQGTRIGCPAAAPIVNRLAGDGEVRLARTVMTDHCRWLGPPPLYDGAMRELALAAPLTPFGWNVAGDSDIDARVQPAAGGAHRLAVSSSAASTRTVVNQLVAGQPGSFQLSWKATMADGRPAASVHATTGCRIDAQRRLDARYDPASGRFTAPFRFDPACEGQWLGFALDAGARDVAIGAVALTPSG